MKFLYSPNFWFTLISVILSLYASISTWRYKHMKLKITLNWVFYAGGQYNICFSLFNPSSQPKALTNVSFTRENHKFSSVTYPLMLTLENAYSTDFPINISPFSAKYVILPFQFVNMPIEDCFQMFSFEINSKHMTREFNLHSKMIDKNEFGRIMSSKNKSIS